MKTSAVCLAIAMATVQVRPQAVLPTITLTPGESYFRVDGVPRVLLGTNTYATSVAEFQTLLTHVGAHEKVVRLHISNGIYPNLTAAGQLDPVWSTAWQDVISAAATNGVHVLPVLDVWSMWSTDVGGAWQYNIFNTAAVLPGCGQTRTCGPAATPTALLTDASVQATWVAWAVSVVNAWKHHPNILGWEIFSEVNKIDGATETLAVAFIEAAARDIDAADPGRPLTASMSGVPMAGDWTSLMQSHELDFLQVHPYAGNAGNDLDTWLLTNVRDRLLAYRKPVMIGESGLDIDFPVDKVNSATLKSRAAVGVNQAIWAGAVSGAMTARMLWFQDGYDQEYDMCADSQYASYAVCADGDAATILQLHELYFGASAPVATFLNGVDYTDFAPLDTTVDANELFGAALGNSDRIIGWIRDAQSIAATNWTWRQMSNHSVSVAVTGPWRDWMATFYDTTTGDALAPVNAIYAHPDATGTVSFTLPDFQGSIAFKMEGLDPLAVEIDIRWGDENRINPQDPGLVPVAILSAPDFNPSDITVPSVRFGPGLAEPQHRTYQDVNRDSIDDLIVAFRASDTGLSCGDTRAFVIGHTTTGRSFAGVDAVTIIGGC